MLYYYKHMLIKCKEKMKLNMSLVSLLKQGHWQNWITFLGDLRGKFLDETLDQFMKCVYGRLGKIKNSIGLYKEEARSKT